MLRLGVALLFCFVVAGCGGADDGDGGAGSTAPVAGAAGSKTASAGAGSGSSGSGGSGSGSSGAGGSGSSGQGSMTVVDAGAGRDAGEEIPTSEIIDRILAACTQMCSACGPEGCMDDCRISGARHTQCVVQYLDALECMRTEKHCRSYEGACAGSFAKLGACWTAGASRPELDCKAACETRAELNCPGESGRDVCVDTCAKAEAKPECAAAITTFTSCAKTSRNICAPNTGEVLSECKPQSMALQQCASASGG